MQAGKGLDERKAEVRVRFKPNTRTQALFGTTLPGNELVMRIQPNEACYLTTYSREPGLEEVIKPTSMEMSWATQFPGERNNKHATVETSQSHRNRLCQDRLRTDIGKTQPNNWRFVSHRGVCG
jgi:glucose-6-phosphate 1-dehydrogenase